MPTNTKKPRTKSSSRDATAAPKEAATPDFNKKCAELRTKLTAAEGADIETRYQVGVIVRELKNEPGKYGTKAVERAVEELKIPSQTLYRYATVVDAWTRELINQFIAEGVLVSTPVTWSHLVVTARIPDADKREGLLRRAIKEKLSSRTLLKEAKNLAGKASPRKARKSNLLKKFGTWARADVTKLQDLKKYVVEVEVVGEEVIASLTSAKKDSESLVRAADEAIEAIERKLEGASPHAKKKAA
jgi:tRNA(Ser,Leu) C12 N-acetylase TAN1